MDDPVIAKVFSIVGGPTCVSAADGQRVYEKIAPLIRDGRAVSLSFEGVETLISAFLNAAIGQLYGQFSEEQIRKLFTVRDMSQDDLALLKRVVENAKRYFSNRQNVDAAWKTEVGDEEE